MRVGGSAEDERLKRGERRQGGDGTEEGERADGRCYLQSYA